MGDRADIVRYKLFSNEKGLSKVIPEPTNYDKGNKDIIERNSDSKQFEVSKSGSLEFYGIAFDYILALQSVYGIIPDLRLIELRKEDDTIKQRWKVFSNVGLDLGTCEFDFVKNTVKLETKTGGLMQIIDTRFDDEYDVFSNETAEGTIISDIETVDVKLDPRQIFRRSRLFADDDTTIFAVVTGNDGLVARAIPFKVDYSSDPLNIQTVQSTGLNANNGNYTDLSFSNTSNAFYLVADRDRVIRLNGTVKTRIKKGNFGTFKMDLVRYKTEDLLFDEIVLNLDSCNPSIVGDICQYTFNNYEVEVSKDDSFAIAILSDTSDGIEYDVFDTSIIVEEDDVYPQTYTKGFSAFYLLKRLVALSTGFEDSFYSDLLSSGGDLENLIIVHGTQLRNMPRILNEGETDETVVQSSTSIQDVIGAISIIRPLMYGTKKIGNKEYFYVEDEKDSQRNFKAIKLGETKSKFNLIGVSSETRSVLADNYYSSINIGSESTGNEYGEVNNLYSICGNAKWNTINNTTKSSYEVLTSFRTGSVDVELTRQKQYEDNPDLDSDFDDDWFMLDCKNSGIEYELKKWADFYTSIPTNVYSPETEYNWSFTPYELFKGHSWKIASGLYQYPAKSIIFISSNCSSNLITDGFQHDSKILHTSLSRPTYNNMMIKFDLQVNQEISLMLRGFTSDIDNKFGLVEFLSDGIKQYGRLISVDENDEGKFELIEAYI